MWSIWDKTSDINGFSAEVIFARNKHLQGEETIYIKTVGGRVTQIEGKSILANHYGIDPALPDEEFIAEYERVISAPAEDTDTATYDELAGVYKEGVTGIDE